MVAWWAAAALAVTTLSGVVGRWMVLRFLRRIYERGGAEDLKVAAEALRRTRSWTVAEKLAGGRRAVTRRGEQQAE